MANAIQNSGVVEEPKRLLLELASLHQLSELLPLAVQRMSLSPSVALVRIWLTQPPLPTDCASCRFAVECTGREQCLHLVASSGRSLANAAENIRAALAQCQGKIYGANGAATMLGLKPTTLNSRIKSLGIRNG